LDAKSPREGSTGSSDTQSLVLGSIFYTKPHGIAQEENQKSYWKRRKIPIAHFSHRGRRWAKLVRPLPGLDSGFSPPVC